MGLSSKSRSNARYAASNSVFELEHTIADSVDELCAQHAGIPIYHLSNTIPMINNMKSPEELTSTCIWSMVVQSTS